MRRAARWRRSLLLAMAAAVALLLPASAFSAAGASRAPVADRLEEIDSYVRDQMDKGNIPGLAIAVVEGGDTVVSRGYGWADRAEKRRVTDRTLFELGSTSKAFTALAVLRLEAEGRLDLNAPASRYLPWLSFRYKGEEADVTLSQLLHHTSGIPFRTIGDIPAARDEGALERTVRGLSGAELDFAPGEKYLYATINYDVLGLIVQQAAGQSYESYVRERVLAPLGLMDTHLYEAPAGADMAQGYKIGLLAARAYDAPAYRGNVPAGYVISSAADMAKWLKLQLSVSPGAGEGAGSGVGAGDGKDAGSGAGSGAEAGDGEGVGSGAGSGDGEGAGSGAGSGAVSGSGLDPALIGKSHEPDRTVKPSPDGSSYAAGWSVYQSGEGEWSHGGNNPNFSSYFVFRPSEGIGVAVLANLNSAYVQAIGQGVMNLILGKELPDPAKDMYKSMDSAASAVLIVAAPILLLTLWLLGTAVFQLARGERRFAGRPGRAAAAFAVLAAVLAGFGYCLYRIPDVLYYGLDWRFLLVWTPATLPAAVLAVFAAVLLFGLYFVLTQLAPKPGERSLFSLIALSLASGFGNALIIFVVNEALNRGDDADFPSGLLVYLIAGIAVYVVGQKLVRTRLIRVANDMVYRKRTELTKRILNASYRRVEQLEQGKIQTALNNDTETISDFSNIVITGATGLVTLVCCFVYMGTISVYGLLVSIFVIVAAAGLHFLFGRQANRLWEQTRDIQNVFFAFIHHMTSGFKELSLSGRKREAFREDMFLSSLAYRDKRIQGDMKFANVNVIGELMFSLVIGVIAFLFPVLFPAMKEASIRTYVFVLLYMTGPIHAILGTIPNLIRVRISWKRIDALAEELDSVRGEDGEREEAGPAEPFRTLELRGVAYRHRPDEAGESFAVGPVDLSFRAGEITFITGGNGSGKSTLARLATGLYAPEEGEVRVNGVPQAPERLGRHFSAVFSDYHLFEKLYGIETDGRDEEIDKYMFLLHLADKVRIRDGSLSTLALSTGQRKRLALLISYLEDRPVYLFDEWAADQDPEFRRFFYDSLLPELKERGKCVIAITHDDRYFGLADRIVKLEMGQVAFAGDAGGLPRHGMDEAG